MQADTPVTLNSILVAGNTVLAAFTAFFLKRSLDKLDELDKRSVDHGERLSRIEGVTSGPYRFPNE
jgi:hypothetical protein